MEANSHSHLVVNLSEERPKKLIQEAVDDVCPIDKLGDELLLEILIRLPNCESATLCKSVSKHWLTLISSNLFVAQFERNHRETHLPFAIVSRYYNGIQNCQRTHVYSKDKEANFSCFGLTSDFLTQLCNEREQPRLEAVHMDLLLFRIERISRRGRVECPIPRKYVICNPRTKKWISIPLASESNAGFGSAIVCEPYCSSENYKGKYCNQDSYRYRVLSIRPTFGSESSVHPQLNVYKSETHQWEKLLLSSTHCSINLSLMYPPTMYNGKLHFLNESNIVAFDPFGAEDECGVVLCCVIDLPLGSNMGDDFVHLSTSSGSLLFCTGHWNQSDSCLLKVWDLKDYDKGEWRLKHEFSMIDLIPSEANTIDASAVFTMRVLGFHPYDKDIVYVFCDPCILECNMQVRTSLVVYEYQDIKDGLASDRNEGILTDESYRVFLPWWPTPVPALTQDKSL